MRFRRYVCLLTLLCLLVSALPGLGASAEARYYITVDLTNQIVTVYDNGNRTESGIVRQMICSTGKDATPTPTGTYTLPSKTHSNERKEWYYFSNFNCYAKWATRIVGGILFHSVLFTASKSGPTKSSVKALGSKASHGCIRLRIDDAHWIAVNCPGGTHCKIFKSGAANRDLRNRLLNRTFSRDEQTYDQFMGRPSGTAPAQPGVGTIKLSRGKKGELVVQLQARLRALGYSDAAPTGKFGKETKNAVKAFQATCGLKKTGKVDNALWNRLFANDAPIGLYATLTEGWQGPVVGVLQQALADLKLFGGAVDGNYGPDTTAAVALYQQYYNHPMTGVATPALQSDAINRAQSVKGQFAGTDYQMVSSSFDVTLATVTAKHYVRMRSAPSKKGKKLAKLTKNTQVKVLMDDGGDWIQVAYGGVQGFVPRKNLSIYPGTEFAVEYVAVQPPEPGAEVVIPGAEGVAMAAMACAEPLLAAGEDDGEPIAAPVEAPVAEPVAESLAGLSIEYGTEPVEAPAETFTAVNGLEFEAE